MGIGGPKRLCYDCFVIVIVHFKVLFVRNVPFQPCVQILINFFYFFSFCSARWCTTAIGNVRRGIGRLINQYAMVGQ